MSIEDVVYKPFFNYIKIKSDYFIPFLDRRMSCEKWIQAEFIHFLYDLKTKGLIQDATAEKNYSLKGLCDLWFKANDNEIWLELQVIVTNYGKPGKPITNQVDHVIGDANKLLSSASNGTYHLLFFVFPLDKYGSNDIIWSKHFNKISTKMTLIMEPYSFDIDERNICKIYIGIPKMNHDISGIIP
jgi:hypothetical protein